MTGSNSSFDPERISVQVRQVVGRAASEAEEMVHCPARERTVSLDDCLECHASDGLVDEGGQRWVRCRRLALGRGPSAQPAPVGLEAAQRTPVHEVMSRNVFCVRASVSVEELVKLLLDLGVQGAPVVDAEGRPLGVVSQTDLVRQLDGEGEPLARAGGREQLRAGVPALAGKRVEDVMTLGAVTVAENAPLAEAAALMAERGLHRLPVLSAEGRVVGLITAFDLIRWMATQAARRPAAPAVRSA